jgi:hypothetical protein
VNTREATEWFAEFGWRHHGVVSGRAARIAGVSEKALRHRVDRGDLVRLANGVYRLRHHPPTWRSALWAAIVELDPAAAVVSHRSAARLHGLWAYRETEVVEVTILRAHDHHGRLARVHTTSLLDLDHFVELEGFPVTSLARTIFDLCGDPDHRPLRTEAQRQAHRLWMLQVVNDAIRRHGLTVLAELAVLAAIGKRGRSGTALVREIFGELGEDYVPDESNVETVFAELCRVHGLPRPDKQVRFGDADGDIGRVDFVFTAARLIVEIDSKWHDGPLDRRRDRRRDVRLEGQNWTVLRFRWPELVTTPEKVVRKLRTHLRRSEPVVTSAPMGAEVIPHSVRS